ncbi:MAG: hypothetical protein GYB36_07840 [Alphaproteobacteria bacterium]|nr:hypothetical protein [Alphaproteobacteria bacterium]
MDYFAFVLMPFDEKFEDTYKFGIQAIAAEKGIRAERVDEQTFSEPILERIYRQIDAADLIIADMTGRNPNVFYEVGYAHARAKLVVLLTSDAADIPFDLKHHRHLIYGGSIKQLTQKLGDELSWCKEELVRRAASPYLAVLKSASGSLEKKGAWRDEGQATIQLELKNVSGARGPEIDAVVVHTGPSWRFSYKGEEVDAASSPNEGYAEQHIFHPRLKRLGSGQSIPVRLHGVKTLWSSFGEGGRQEEYRIKGVMEVEFMTDAGSFSNTIQLNVLFDEIPF